MDLPDILARRIGPFPVAGWLGIVAGGVGLSVVINRRTAADPSAAGVLAAINERIAGQQLTDPFVTPPDDLDAVDLNDGGAFANNTEWVNAAVSLLALSGFSAVAVATALNKWLDGQFLTSRELGIVERAIRGLGPPPYGAVAVVGTSQDGQRMSPEWAKEYNDANPSDPVFVHPPAFPNQG